MPQAQGLFLEYQLLKQSGLRGLSPMASSSGKEEAVGGARECGQGQQPAEARMGSKQLSQRLSSEQKWDSVSSGGQGRSQQRGEQMPFLDSGNESFYFTQSLTPQNV